VAALLPVLGLVNHYFVRYSFVGDHFQYLAGIGPLALAGAGIWRALERIGGGKGFVPPTLCGFLLAGLGLLTWRQAHTFQDYETLWPDVLAKNPGCWMAHNNWGIALMMQGKLDAAVEQFRAALRTRMDSAEGHSNLAELLRRQGNIEEALAEFRAALRLDPRYADAHWGLGLILEAQGKADEALAQYLAAVQAKPYFAEAYNKLSILYEKRGDAQEALRCAAEAVRFRPDLAEAHYNLATALLQEGQARQAAAEYRESLRLEPDSPAALNDLAWILAANASDSLRNGAEAVTLAERACQLTQFREPLLLGTLAAAYAEAGRFDDAVNTAEKARNLAEAAGEKKLADMNRQMLELYRSNQPYREGQR
jgi:tetratricopeptide (TPR) repeat protein